MKTLTQLSLIDVCRIDAGAEQCMFLARDPVKSRFFCMKITDLAATVRDTVETQLKRLQEHNICINLPAGDNCRGFGVGQENKNETE